MAAEAAIGGVLSGTLQSLTESATSLLVERLTQSLGLEDEIRKLADTFALIKDVLEDAEQKQVRDGAVSGWLHVLKEVAYDAEDVLDEFFTEAAQKRAAIQAGGVSGLMKRVSAKITLLLDRGIVNRTIRIRERLEAVADNRQRLGLQVAGGSAHVPDMLSRRRETTSLPNKQQQVFGREKETEEIIAKLLCSDEGDVALIPIVGMGGIGKTTLARTVFNDSRVEGHFPVIRKWLHVGQNFDPCALIMKILEPFPLDDQGKPITSLPGNPSLQDFHMALRAKLKNDRFLIVLDDAWNENRSDWEQLWEPLTHGGEGGKVVVTARSQRVPNAIRPISVGPLPLLSNEECWLIFESHAFVDGNSGSRHGLKDIGLKIVEKLKGVPLAAKVAGRFLCNASEETWSRTLRVSEVWPLIQNENDILPILSLSYKYLDTQLKRCFVFCSTFPKNYLFEKIRLVRIWMANGFVRSQTHMFIEDVGSGYFDELVDKYFFQYVDGHYVMHDLIHDLAQSISKEECLIVGEKNSKTADAGNARHMSSIGGGIPEGVDLKKVRTFLCCCKDLEIPRSLLRQSACIRVLDLSDSRIAELPGCIGALKHLRYLDITDTPISKLPDSLCDICNLQTLRIGLRCELPKRVNRLINLQHLEASPQLISGIHGIWKLTSLQGLTVFGVNERKGNKIEKLKHMTQVRQLSVWNLENVRSGEEARLVSMNDKLYLDELELVWNEKLGLERTGIAEDVLESLQPPSYIRGLWISGYYGLRHPNWLGSEWLSRLTSIVLCGCKKWTRLPPLGGIRTLKKLRVEGMHEVEKVGGEFYGGAEGGAFPSLEYLKFWDMPKWNEWCTVEKGQLFPSLHELQIGDCPLLANLPDLPPALPELWIFSVGLHNLPGFWGSNSQICRLIVQNCSSLTNLSPLLQHNLSHLDSVVIWACEKLVSFWEQGQRYGTLPSLRSLSISWCPKLRTVAEEEEGFMTISSVSELIIQGCSNIRSLPREALRHLTNLQVLYILYCKELTLLEWQVLASIEILRVFGCPKLEIRIASSSSSSSSQLLGKDQLLGGLQSIKSLRTDNRSLIAAALLLSNHLVSLEGLTIKGCPELTSFAEEEEAWGNLTSLHRLTIEDCENLRSLPRKWKSLPSLERLDISNNPMIERLPEEGLPMSLRGLWISGCPKLKAPDRHLIAHIHYVYIP